MILLADSTFKKSILALSFICASFVCTSAFNLDECRKNLHLIARELFDKSIYNARIASFLNAKSGIQEEDLILLCDDILLYSKDLGDKGLQVAAIKDDLVKYLRSFVASGLDLFELDPNFACFYDEQNPNFIVTFKNPEGKVKIRKYALKIYSYGLKFEVAVKVLGITIVGDNFNYYDTNKKFKLSSGIDLSINPLILSGIPISFSLIYAGIDKSNWGIFMMGVDLGFAAGISYVYSGEMDPIFE